ncbi:alpha-amylase family glycosyl hydrolase, partial [Actinomadura sediminis]
MHVRPQISSGGASGRSDAPEPPDRTRRDEPAPAPGPAAEPAAGPAAGPTSGQVTGPATGPVPDTFDEDAPRVPHWFKTAVFYEVSVRGFADSDNDGYGDLRGLISKLDHLQWLGIDCLWLLPIY